MTRRGFTYTELLCAAGIIAVVWLMVLPCLARSRNRADETGCVQHLRNVSWALSMYAQDHCGHLPPTLTDLVPRYLPELGVLRCPRVVAVEKRLADHGHSVAPHTLDYAYQPGLCTDDRPEEALVWDSVARHRGGGNVLYLSGAAEFVDEAAIETLNAAVARGREAGEP